MSTYSMCKKIGCGYYVAAVPGRGMGCSRFATAYQCPIAYITGLSNTEYEVFGQTSDAPVLEGMARAGCPDPSIRLTALGDWPVEAMDTLLARERLGDDPMAEKTKKAIENLCIGAVYND
jgi:hypothetical protein